MYLEEITQAFVQQLHRHVFEKDEEWSDDVEGSSIGDGDDDPFYRRGEYSIEGIQKHIECTQGEGYVEFLVKNVSQLTWYDAFKEMQRENIAGIKIKQEGNAARVRFPDTLETVEELRKFFLDYEKAAFDKTEAVDKFADTLYASVRGMTPAQQKKFLSQVAKDIENELPSAKVSIVPENEVSRGS